MTECITPTVDGLTEQHICPDCGKKYTVFAMFAINQGKCTECRQKDEQKQYCPYCNWEISPLNMCGCGGHCISKEDFEIWKARKSHEGEKQ